MLAAAEGDAANYMTKIFIENEEVCGQHPRLTGKADIRDLPGCRNTLIRVG